MPGVDDLSADELARELTRELDGLLEVEDADVARAAKALAASQADGTAPGSHGIRFKSLERPTRARGVRSLVAFVDHLLSAGGRLDGFVATLPKVTSVAQV